MPPAIFFVRSVVTHATKKVNPTFTVTFPVNDISGWFSQAFNEDQRKHSDTINAPHGSRGVETLIRVCIDAWKAERDPFTASRWGLSSVESVISWPAGD